MSPIVPTLKLFHRESTMKIPHQQKGVDMHDGRGSSGCKSMGTYLEKNRAQMSTIGELLIPLVTIFIDFRDTKLVYKFGIFCLFSK